MDVRYLLPGFLRTPEVAIKAPPTLPETMGAGAIGLPIPHRREKLRRMPANVTQGRVGDRLLEGSQNLRHRINALAGPKHQMHMFRHDDPGPEGKIMERRGTGEGGTKPLPGTVLEQEGLATVTGKGQIMGVAGVVDASTGLVTGR